MAPTGKVRQLTASGRRLGRMMESVTESLRAFGAQTTKLNGRMQAWLEREYLLHHDRLPGSLRTRRLRKKRQRRIQEWFRTRSGELADG